MLCMLCRVVSCRVVSCRVVSCLQEQVNSWAMYVPGVSGSVSQSASSPPVTINSLTLLAGAVSFFLPFLLPFVVDAPHSHQI